MAPGTGGTIGGLLERELELDLLAGAVEACRAGRGSTVVIEGAAGIGKTSLLREVGSLAQDAGLRVVGARGAELERSFPYGVIRQFFEAFLFTVDADERPRWMHETKDMAERMFGGRRSARADPAEDFALLHSLYWMCVSIADERPLMMVLDDAQWADAPSLRFLEFSSRRVEQIPFMFMIASRVPDDSSPAPLISLLADGATTLVRPMPLSAQAVEQLVHERVDPAADRSFTLACHEVTRGNPFLLRELVHEILDERLPANADSAGRVRAIGPRGVSRVVLLRLRRLPQAARDLARALSVAGDGFSLPDLAALADLGDEDAREAAVGLERAELVDLDGGIRFTHPVLGTAVHEDMSVLERSELHRRAALMRRQRGHAEAEVAAHLLHVQPGAGSWVVDVLQAAAGRAEGVGDPRAAIQLLDRALRERLEEPVEAGLLAQLGRAEARVGRPEGLEHLRRALSIIDDPRRAADVSLEMANVMKFSGRPDEAADLLLDALKRGDLAPGALRRRLQAELLGTRFISPRAARRVRGAIDGASVPVGEPRDLLDSFLLAESAYDAVAELRPSVEGLHAGRRAFGGGQIATDPVLGGQVAIVAAVALIWAEDFEFVDEVLSSGLSEARKNGAALAAGNLSTMRAMCRFRAGRLLEAEADASAVVELSEEVDGIQTLLPPAMAYFVLAGIERGADLAELRTVAFAAGLDAGNQMLPFTQLNWARAELLAAMDDLEGALRQYRACNRKEDDGYGANNPSMLPWREGAALVLDRMQDSQGARELAEDAVSRARAFGAPRALGVALRARALVGPPPRRVEGLREAVQVLQGARSPLELVRARTDLGAALRASGARNEAQRELEQASELAGVIGARRLAARAAVELEAAGVRPRREPAGGVASLTPSERRVAELAVAGQTNREIAQALFVTEKTVETHLGHVYDKLGVRSRRKLPEVFRVPLPA